MSQENFVPLHIHSEYSLLDGSIKIKKLVKELVKRGHTAAALTDHDGQHGILEFYLACQAENINGIIGYEINVEPLLLASKQSTCHLILLAENNTGLSNLIKLCTIANTTGKNALFQDSTNVSFAELEQHSEGLIVLTGCMQGELCQLVLNNKIDEAKKYLFTLERIFKKENIFIELIDNGIYDQKSLIQSLHKLSLSINFNLVATTDTHYLQKKDKDTHLSLLAIKQKLQKSDVQSFPENVHFHLPSFAEMQEIFAFCPEALENTKKISARCKLQINTNSFHMPNFVMNSKETEDECLIRLSRDGLEARKTAVKHWMGEKFSESVWKDYKDRLEYELKVIINMKFSGYFLIVQDFINWAKNQNIPVGPGRGSAAGSVVSYALNITNIDPIRFNLLFERFLNPERISLPDIDTDFCQEKREDVLQYVYQKYGRRSVSQIATFGRMMAKNALKNLARITGWTFHESNEFAKLIPHSPGITLEQALEEEPKIKERLDADERARQLWDGSLEIEGTLNALGVHAAGVIISDKALDEKCPLLESEGQILTQFENKYAEKIGLIKFDFLGLKTLTVIDKTLQIIKENYDLVLNLDELNLEDKKVYDMISTAHVTGVFQLESMGMRKLIADLRPTCFSDIIALLALFRPGPLGSGMVEDFVKRKHGKTAVEYPLEVLESILSDTYGIIVYQEQVQKIASVLANYSLGEADLLRRAMGKKDKNEMKRQKDRFISGAMQNGYPAEKSSELFDLMEKFAEYGFNKSHSAAYGWVTYQTAWLKTYYPTEFMAALMSCDLGNTEKITGYINDCRRMNIKILPPCVNESKYKFHVPNRDTIQFGLGAIKGVGEGIINEIIDERNKNGKYNSVQEFMIRIYSFKISKKLIECLTKAGAFDSISTNRKEIFENSDTWLKIISKEISRSEKTFGGIFDLVDNNKTVNIVKNIMPSLQTKKTNFWNFLEKLSYEEAQIGSYMTGHPADIFKEDLEKLSTTRLCDIHLYLEPDEVKDYQRKLVRVCGIISFLFEKRNKEGDLFLVFKIQDGTGEFECVIFAKQYAALETKLNKGDAVYIECKLKKGIEEDTARGVVQSIMPLAQKRLQMVQKIILDTNEQFLYSKENVVNLQKVLNTYKGNIPVYLNSFLPSENMNLHAKLDNFNVTPTDEFLITLKNNWDKDFHVKIIYSSHSL